MFAELVWWVDVGWAGGGWWIKGSFFWRVFCSFLELLLFVYLLRFQRERKKEEQRQRKIERDLGLAHLN